MTLDKIIKELELNKSYKFRELHGIDYMIHRAIGWQDNDECGWSMETDKGTYRTNSEWPYYTSNLQDTKKLIPEEQRGQGWAVVAQCGTAPAVATCGPKGGPIERGTHRTNECIALCIAALKVRRNNEY